MTSVPPTRQEVVVVDVQMPFMSMVVFILKWFLASIPALIVIGILAAILSAVLGGLFWGMLGG